MSKGLRLRNSKALEHGVFLTSDLTKYQEGIQFSAPLPWATAPDQRDWNPIASQLGKNGIRVLADPPLAQPLPFFRVYLKQG